MTRGRFWLQAATCASIACGFVGERIARGMGVLPDGWGWSMAAAVTSGIIGFVTLVVILTKCGR